MVAIAAPAKILVSGASGFLGAHVSRELLESGYTVVGTVRSPSKGEYLKNLYKAFAPRFSYAIVSDIAAEGAFDDVVREGEFAAVEHTASPFHNHANDPSELIDPAVKGTVGMLKSIAKYGPTVERVVVTSSVAACVRPETGSFGAVETEWNTISPYLVGKEGKNSPIVHWYLASKTLAERAAWAFVKENKVNFDLVTINPPYIYGPPIHEVSSPKNLNESAAEFLQALIHVPPENEAVSYSQNCVDVRDVALAHRLVLEKEEAGGERFIPSAGPFAVQQWYDALRKAGLQNIPEGYPSTPINTASFHIQDGSKAARVLGLNYRPLSVQVVDMLEAIRSRWPNVEKDLA